MIAEHAESLGYDGLILFMDELILWLATLIHDQKFVAREASKITNFVEGGDARRAIPWCRSSPASATCGNSSARRCPGPPSRPSRTP